MNMQANLSSVFFHIRQIELYGVRSEKLKSGKEANRKAKCKIKTKHKGRFRGNIESSHASCS